MMKKHDVHIIAGPTASGKSAHALDLARKLDGVIINADSLQLYNGLSLLTAQPSADDKQQIPHLSMASRRPM
jgi:tRNA dimethylallyltransferase